MPDWLNEIFLALLIFLPAYCANMAPVLLVQTKLFKKFGKPIDGGKMLWGERLFGEGKTWFGIIAAMMGGVVGNIAMYLILLPVGFDFYSEQWALVRNWILNLNLLLFFLGLLFIALIGAFIGLGAILGDLVKSFFKRRFKISSGKPWPPFDQIDFIIGAWIAMTLFSPSQNWNYFYIALLITPLLHLVSNVIAFKLKLKKVWW